MQNDPKDFMTDISANIDLILNEYLKEVNTYREFEKNVTMQEIELGLVNIGEAVEQLRDSGISVPFSESTINLGNVLSNQYDGRGVMNIWRSINNELPSIKTEVDRLLSQSS